MSKRFGWLLGMAVLVAIGTLVACGVTYNHANDGLVLVSSQGSGLLESYVFSISSGSIGPVNNTPTDTGNLTCVLKGVPSQVLIDPAGLYAYSILTATPSTCGSGSATGIQAFKIDPVGTLTSVGPLVTDPNPTAMVMDQKGKFLYVAEGTNSAKNANTSLPSKPCPGTKAQYEFCVYAIGSGGSLTPVAADYVLPQTPQVPNFSALALTPTALPGLLNGVQQAVCSSPGNNPPPNEFLYAVDSVNYEVWAFTVNLSTGAIGGPGSGNQVIGYPTAPVPFGITVDPCDRFVYVSNGVNNSVSAFALCEFVTQGTCPLANGTLLQVSGSPFSLQNGAETPGPLLVDPFGNYLYVLDTDSNQISMLHISQVTGSLTSITPPTVSTGVQPTSLVIRSDDSWLFVANFGSQDMSQFSIVPNTGVLSASPTVATDNWPWGVAVK